MIDLVLYAIAIIALFASSLNDIKKREVPDWISYGFVAAALGARLLYSVYTNDYFIFLDGVLAAALFFGIGFLFYILAQWGGGDVKVAAGIGAVLGLHLTSLIFVVLLLFMGAFYGIAWSIYLAIKHKSEFMKSFNWHLRKFKFLIIPSACFFLATLLGFFVIDDKFLAFLIFSLGVIEFIGLFTFLFVKAVEESCLFKKVKASELTEGDWIAETIKLKGKIVITEKNYGITKEQLQKLNHYKKLVLIKTGMPFVPAFLLAFAAFIAFKDAILLIL